jgi:hypothetical protein
MAKHMACMYSMQQVAMAVNLYKINHCLKAKA